MLRYGLERHDLTRMSVATELCREGNGRIRLMSPRVMSDPRQVAGDNSMDIVRRSCLRRTFMARRSFLLRLTKETGRGGRSLDPRPTESAYRSQPLHSDGSYDRSGERRVCVVLPDLKPPPLSLSLSLYTPSYTSTSMYIYAHPNLLDMP
ncbi:hypothetical protein BDV26DRAFT_48294 [Aspergillus bertholletiae]|uniref:Uncharacterized protein n=1 Tax=Aspergillus bertholletiae TaxID=1226010 RepID=A0A5N7BKA6_9EURO|nr:hypothetical protein BDV26DRAFT_48294 [Aspergillus bertholletiae]